ncbi:MAG: aminotransferase class I/II-fold pyridoxal phosphate-dependent enzyme [Nitrospirota bacterium]
MQKKKIDISGGISPLGPSKKVKAAIRKAIKNVRDHYEPELARLGKLFSSKYGVPEDGILFSNSVRELIYLITAVFMPKKVLVAGPALKIYEEASSAAGAEVLYLNASEGSGFKTGTEIIGKIPQGVDLLFIANPNRITGRLTDRDVMNGILSFAAEKDILAVVDESLIEFAEQDCYCIDNLKMDNIIFLRTTANFYGLPGLELACAVSSGSITEDLTKRKTCTLNALAVAAAKAAFKDKTYKRLARELVKKEKNNITEKIKKINGIKVYSSDSNIILVKTVCPGERVLNSLARHGFLVQDCRDIEGLDDSFLRFSISKHEYNLKLLRILTDCLQNAVSDRG